MSGVRCCRRRSRHRSPPPLHSGVRAHDLRASLLLSAHGDAIYPAAALCVVMPLAAAKPPAAADANAAAATPPSPPTATPTPPTPTARFYREHTAAVLSMALHPDGATVASGQQGSEPPILVWDARTLKTLAVLRRGHAVGVCCLAFGGGDGSLLASVDLTGAPMLCLWDWRRGELLASACVGRQVRVRVRVRVRVKVRVKVRVRVRTRVRA